MVTILCLIIYTNYCRHWADSLTLIHLSGPTRLFTYQRGFHPEKREAVRSPALSLRVPF